MNTGEVIIVEQDSIHTSKPRKKIDTDLFQKNDEEKKKLKALKKLHKAGLK